MLFSKSFAFIEFENVYRETNNLYIADTFVCLFMGNTGNNASSHIEILSFITGEGLQI